VVGCELVFMQVLGSSLQNECRHLPKVNWAAEITSDSPWKFSFSSILSSMLSLLNDAWQTGSGRERHTIVGFVPALTQWRVALVTLVVGSL
jgi:hypothetical protein